MVEILFPILVGMVLGILAGLGVGGGSLLILWLTAVIGTEYQSARMINLLFFLPCALGATIFRWKQGAIDCKAVIPAIMAGCVSALFGSWIGKHLQLEILKKMFGILLIASGIKELLYRPRKAR